MDGQQNRRPAHDTQNRIAYELSLRVKEQITDSGTKGGHVSGIAFESLVNSIPLKY